MSVFGSKVFVKDNSQGKGKLDSRAKEGVCIGYDRNSKAHRVHIPKTKKLVISRDVKFMNDPVYHREYQEILDE